MAHTQTRKAGIATGISLLLPITLSTMAILLLAPVLPLLLNEFRDVPGHDYWVPMILTVPALCVALISPVAGIFGDRYGRRRLLIIALLFYAVVGLAPLFLSNLWAILISRIGVGITEALITTLSTTMIGDYFEGESRNRWLAGQTAVASMSALVFFNLGGQLGALGWRTPFWVYGSALLMLLCILLFTWKQGAAGEHLVSEEQKLGSASWADFPWKRMSGILGVTIFGSILFYTIQIQTAPGLFALGLNDPAKAGFLTSIASIGVPLGTLMYSRVSRISVYKLLSVEFILLALGFILMTNGSTVLAYLIGCSVNQIAAGMLLPTLLVWAMDGLPFDLRARGTGLWTAAFSLGQWLSPIATTTIGRATGGLLSSFQYLGFASLVAAVLAVGYWMTRGNRAAAAEAV